MYLSRAIQFRGCQIACRIQVPQLCARVLAGSCLRRASDEANTNRRLLECVEPLQYGAVVSEITVG